MIHSEQSGNQYLIQRILEEIDRSPQQAISFAHFMGMCLYDREYGYYMSNRIKVGKEGDFYTSSAIGTIMGEILAKYCVKFTKEHFTMDTTVQLVEWGGGNGDLAKHLLDELKLHHPGVYERIAYIAVEESPFHRQLQQKSLNEHAERVQWLSANDWFAQGKRAATIVLANELLDAFPVHRVIRKQGKLYEIYVAWDKARHHFVERNIPLADKRLKHYIKVEGITLTEGQRIEINLEAEKWIADIGKWLNKGVLITIDYGDEAREIYADHRMEGTLLCYRNHQAYDNPYIYIGEQDITAHVNFSACIRAGEKAGFERATLTDQKTFLVEAGILEKLKDHTIGDPFHPQAIINRTIRQILWSDQMSELFKVLVQIK